MTDENTDQGLAVVTGASSGIGYELARCAAGAGYYLLIVADEAEIADVAAELRREGACVDAVEADLSTCSGIERVISAIASLCRCVALLMANAGRGFGHAFLDQDPADVQKGDVVSGWKNKVISAAANVTPSAVLARVHRTVSEPDA